MARVFRSSSKCVNDGCVEVSGQFHKSSFSGGDGCVETAVSDAHVFVRDSKQGNASPILKFTPDEWNAFIAGVKAGEFDLE